MDYWTCVHIATGLLIGFSLARAGMPMLPTMVISIPLLIAWEFAEPVLHRAFGQRFPETQGNQIVDVAFGTLGCLIGFKISDPYVLWSVLLEILEFMSG